LKLALPFWKSALIISGDVEPPWEGPKIAERPVILFSKFRRSTKILKAGMVVLGLLEHAVLESWPAKFKALSMKL
jgi:hypothetical protein